MPLKSPSKLVLELVVKVLGTSCVVGVSSPAPEPVVGAAVVEVKVACLLTLWWSVDAGVTESFSI